MFFSFKDRTELKTNFLKGEQLSRRQFLTQDPKHTGRLSIPELSRGIISVSPYKAANNAKLSRLIILLQLWSTRAVCCWREGEFLSMKWKESFNWINSKDWDTICQCNERFQDVLMASLLLTLEPAWYLSILIRVGEAADRIWHHFPIPTSLCFQGSKISCQILDFSLGDNLPRARLSPPTPPPPLSWPRAIETHNFL